MRTAIAAWTLAFAAAASAQAVAVRLPDESVERLEEHFPETNERAHGLFYPEIRSLGGAYLGVGADQNYSLACAAAADAIYLVDIDPLVIRLHRALLALVAVSPNPDAFRAHFRPEAEAATLDLLREALGDDWEARRTLRAFQLHRPLLTRRYLAPARLPGWLNVRAWYAHLADLVHLGQVHARVGDLTGPETVRAMGRHAEARGLTFRVLYLSNAEEYFDYDRGFRRNLEALPTDGRSVVLRTLRHRHLPRSPLDHVWHYDLQPVRDLRRRLGSLSYDHVGFIVQDLLEANAPGPRPGLSRLDGDVPSVGTGVERWWLEERSAADSEGDDIRPSRVLVVLLRLIRPSLGREEWQRARAIDFTGTALSRRAPSTLPGAPPLSGQPGPRAPARLARPEEGLLGRLADAVLRDLVPRVLEEGGLPDEAATLRGAPPVADLYDALRLRERAVETCEGHPPDTPAQARSRRVCRRAADLLLPTSTDQERARWTQHHRTLRTALRALVRPVTRTQGGAVRWVELLDDLAAFARRVGD